MFSCLMHLYANFEMWGLPPLNSTFKTLVTNLQICLTNHPFKNPQIHPFFAPNLP